MNISLTVNGARLSANSDSLIELLADRAVGPEQRFVAVAVNNVVVPRSDWPTLRLSDGDRIEIVQPMKGG